MFDTMKTAHAIKSARIKKNMTQMNLADEMGVSYQAVSNWERGNSMPDISKLGQLCEILEISMNELLGNEKQGKTLEKVINVSFGNKSGSNSSEAGDVEKITIDELQDIVSMVPPQDTKRIIEENVKEKEKLNLNAIIGMAPFLDDDYLDELIDRIDVTEQIGDLVGLAPFLSDEALDKAAMLYIKNGKTQDGIRGLVGLAPFMAEETLDKIVMGCLENNHGEDDVNGIIELGPFLEEGTIEKALMYYMQCGNSQAGLRGMEGLAVFADEDSLDRLVDAYLAGEITKEGMQKIASIVCFLPEKTVRKMAEWAMKSGDIKLIQDIAPFM